MVMGPTCGLVLADLGADVIKVEPIDGDKTRHLPGSGAGYFPMFNRNKQSLTVNLKSDEGLALVKRLIADADVVTENFRPGSLDAMGLGYDDLKVDNPRLIYCSLKGFLAGPYQDRSALDEVVQTMGGLTYMTGPPGQPLRAGTSVNDIMGGLFAATGILAALQQRVSTGVGQLVRSSLFENNVFLVGQHMAQYGVTGVPAAPMPARESAWAVYDLFDTIDQQQIFVGVVSDTQWRAFCRVFDLPNLSEDPRYATNAQRVKARATLMPKLRDLFAAMTRAEATRLLEAARLPFAPLQRPEDLFDDPHLGAPGALIPITLPNGQGLPLPALPLEMGGRRLGKRLDLPGPGEHSATIARHLGYSDAEIDQLHRDGILGHQPDPAPALP
jgi:crotonobetainyl-CoA:carnitine CoA-transferase CaiB-like acyl-CoA transferase